MAEFLPIKEPPICTSEDIPHIGEILRRVSAARGVEPQDLDRWATIDDSATSRLEVHGYGSELQLKRYIKGLQSPECGLRITNEEKKILKNLFRCSQRENRISLETGLSQISFNKTFDASKTSPLGILIQSLRQQKNPSFIIDPLWFIHAINGAALYLFGIDPTDVEHPNTEYLKNWQAWHVIATKFHPSSPVRRAHLDRIPYFRGAIDVFFRDENTYPFLFTDQMRWLLCRLNQLSRDNDPEFIRSWKIVTSLMGEYPQKYKIRRDIKFGEFEIRIKQMRIETKEIYTCKGGKINFSLASWLPSDLNAQEAWIHIQKYPWRKNIFFAAEYDKKENFHANNWPELEIPLYKKS